MASRLSTALIAGGSGAGGALMYNNKDSLDQLFPALSHASKDFAANDRYTSEVSKLSQQLDALTRSQRHANTVLVQSSQPSTLLGVPLWQLVGVAGTAGAIYFKVKGYNLNDLVYVSKKHFNDITEVINEQIKTLEETVGEVKQELLERIGLVEDRVDVAQVSIEAKIDAEIAKVDGTMAQFGADLGAVQRDVSENRITTDAIASNVNVVKGDVSHLKDQLLQVSASVQNHTDMLEEYNETLATSMEKQNRGINLLCKYVSTEASDSKSRARLVDELKAFAEPAGPVALPERRGLIARAGLQGSNSRARLMAR